LKNFEITSRSYYNNTSQDYDSTHESSSGPYFEKFTQAIFDFIKIPPHARVLEAGCGTGRFTLKLLNKGYEVFAIDYSQNSLSVLESKAKKLKLDGNLKTFCMPVESLSNKELPLFDVVIGSYLLHHVYNPFLALKAMKKIAKPHTGLIVCIEPNPYNPMWYLQILLEKKIRWSIEKGMVKLPEPVLRSCYRKIGVQNMKIMNYGFFAPLFLNFMPSLFKAEFLISQVPIVKKILHTIVLKAYHDGG